MRVAHGQFVIPFLLFITVVIPPSQAAAWDQSSVGIHYHEGNDHEEDHTQGTRDLAAQRVEWRAANASQHSAISIQILAINDFHGQLSSGRRVSNRPVGGAAVLASYLLAARAGQEKRTVIAHAGGLVGASPPASGLLQDEPSIQFFNLLANQRCSFAHPSPRSVI